MIHLLIRSLVHCGPLPWNHGLPASEDSVWYTERCTYRKETLLRTETHIKQSRRRNNRDYASAIERLEKGSLRTPGESLFYSYLVYETFDVMLRELCCHQRVSRRFARFRAHQRGMANMAKSIVYSKELNELRKYRGKEKRIMKKQIMNNPKLRIVASEDGQFGHESYGPVPRKELILALSHIAVVLLVDRFRTSKACHVCDDETIGGRSHRDL